VIAKDLRSGVEQLGNMIAEASCIVPFTGAGISTECGIPDFRSPGGLAGKTPAIITQNIDNLHQASGFKADHVVELHGNTTYARCIGCGHAYDLPWVKARFEETGDAPDCTICDEPVKTATISFGQAMPEDAMRRATELAQQCDLFLAVGSSLVVWPAAGFPLMARNCGAKLVIINNEPTEQDDVADLVIRFDIGETLGPFVGN